jgi:Flp pilus assembly protein TadD
LEESEEILTDTTRDYMPELLSRLGQNERGSARGLLEQAVQAHPGDPRPLLLLAAELIHAKEIDRAEAAYIAALQLAPGYAIARFQLGLLQLTSARPAAALATWAPLEGLAEADPLRLFKQGLEALIRDDFEQARRWLLEGIAHNKDNPPLNRDMQLVLDRIAGAPARGDAQPAPRRADEADASAQAPGDHFLVSTYRKTH